MYPNLHRSSHIVRPSTALVCRHRGGLGTQAPFSKDRQEKNVRVQDYSQSLPAIKKIINATVPVIDYLGHLDDQTQPMISSAASRMIVVVGPPSGS